MIWNVAVAVIAAPVVLELVPRLLRATSVNIFNIMPGGQIGTVCFSFDDRKRYRDGDIITAKSDTGVPCYSVIRDCRAVDVDENYIKDGREYVRIGEKHYDLTQLEIL